MPYVQQKICSVTTSTTEISNKLIEISEQIKNFLIANCNFSLKSVVGSSALVSLQYKNSKKLLLISASGVSLIFSIYSTLSNTTLSQITIPTQSSVSIVGSANLLFTCFYSDYNCLIYLSSFSTNLLSDGNKLSFFDLEDFDTGTKENYIINNYLENDIYFGSTTRPDGYSNPDGKKELLMRFQPRSSSIDSGWLCKSVFWWTRKLGTTNAVVEISGKQYFSFSDLLVQI